MASKTMVSTSIASLGTSRTPLNRESSIFNITLDELQNSLNESGKNFGSMSMDEFLKNISPSEEGQTVAAVMQGNVHTESQPEGLFQSNLQQGSLTLPRTLSRKTVDEVWKEIQGQKDLQERHEDQQHHQQKQQQQQQGQGVFGEMTLEDFLVKAGIVRDETEVVPAVSTVTGTSFASTFASGLQTPQAVQSIAQNQQQLEWYNYQFKQQQQHQFLLQQQAEAAAAMANRTGPIGGMLLGGNVLEAPLDIGPGLAPGNLPSNVSLSPLATPDTASRRRDFDVVERTVERRQRRMIKNRESAARSRARKQAYTMELETEVMQLKEENLRLKRQRVAQTSAIKQELIGSTRVLRRTRSAPW